LINVLLIAPVGGREVQSSGQVVNNSERNVFRPFLASIFRASMAPNGWGLRKKTTVPIKA